jgi:hypothetical protein
MSKRKNRSAAPNLPQAALERARQQLGEDAAPAPKAEPQVEAVAAAPKETAPAKAPSASRAPRTASTVRTTQRRRVEPSPSKSRRQADTVDMNYVRNRLAHPTRTVTEGELRETYSYVVNDLRSMAVLAAILIACLIVVARFL